MEDLMVFEDHTKKTKLHYRIIVSKKSGRASLSRGLSEKHKRCEHYEGIISYYPIPDSERIFSDIMKDASLQGIIEPEITTEYNKKEHILKHIEDVLKKELS